MPNPRAGITDILEIAERLKFGIDEEILFIVFTMSEIAHCWQLLFDPSMFKELPNAKDIASIKESMVYANEFVRILRARLSDQR